MKTHYLPAAEIVPFMLGLIKEHGGIVVEHSGSRIVVQTAHNVDGADRHVIISK